MKPPAPATTTRSVLLMSGCNPSSQGDAGIDGAATEMHEIGNGTDLLLREEAPAIDDREPPGAREHVYRNRPELGPGSHDHYQRRPPHTVLGRKSGRKRTAGCRQTGFQPLRVEGNDRLPFIRETAREHQTLALFDDGRVRFVRQAENSNGASGRQACLN